MTEFIPSPQEKRDALIRDHTLDLLNALNERIGILEAYNGLSEALAKRFAKALSKIKQEEKQHIKVHSLLVASSGKD